MNNRKRFAAGLLLCCLLLTACGQKPAEPTEPVQEPGTAVEVQTVSRDQLSNENMVSGQVIADSSVSIIPTIAGTVQTVAVALGDHVKKGDLLFRIDTTQITSSYSALQQSYSATQAMTNESIQNAQAALPLAQSALTTAQTNFDNVMALFNVGAASQIEVDQARIQLDSARNQLAQAQSGVAQARSAQQAQLAQIEAQLTQMRTQAAAGTVTSPCDGLITAVNVTKGGLAGQSPAIIIAEGARTRIAVQVSENIFSQLKVGDVAKVTVSAVSPDPFNATIASIAPTANQQTSLYEVRFYTQQGLSFPIGAFADVTIFTNERQDAIIIPSDAILTTGTESAVFIVEGEQTAKRVTVQTGVSGDGVTEVTSGLTGGETLVVKGQNYLSDGAPVRIISGEAAE